MAIPAGTAFKIVRTENAQLREQLAAAEEKVVAAERKASETAAESKDTKALREKVERYEKELAIVNVEATEAFQTSIGKPMKTAEANLTQLATKYEVPMGDLRAAMAEQDPGKRSDALSELSAKFNRLDTATFDRTIAELEGLQRAKTQALGSAAEQLERAKSERERQAAESGKTFQREWETAREKALETLRADKTAIGVIFAPTGDADFDELVSRAIDQATAVDITNISNEELAAKVYRSEVLPLATRLISDQVATIATLEATIAQLRGSQPPIGDGIVPGQQSGPAAPATFHEAATRALDGVLPR